MQEVNPKWFTHDKIDPSLVKEGERFLTVREQMATKSSFPPSEALPPVAKPLNYYDVGGIETIDVIRAKLTPEQYKGYLLGNIIKYSHRLNWKGDTSKDVRKLGDYTSWLGQEICKS